MSLNLSLQFASTQTFHVFPSPLGPVALPLQMVLQSALVTKDTQDHCVASVPMVTTATHQQSLACLVNAMETLIHLFRVHATLPQESASSAPTMPQDSSVRCV